MNPSQSNTDAAASSKDAEATRLMNSGENHGPPRDSSFQSSALSAPLLPSIPYDPEMMDLEPPSYDSVVAQDASDLKNRFGTSLIGNLHQARNQAPYPTGPGSAPQTPYPSKAGFSPSGTPAQAPYPTETGYSPRAVGNPPYLGGPGLGSTVTSQPPYPTGSGYTPGPASQAPYPTGPVAMPKPGAVKTRTEVGFIDSVPMNHGLSRLESRPRTVLHPTALGFVNRDGETQEQSTHRLPKAAEEPHILMKFVMAALTILLPITLFVLFGRQIAGI